MKPIRLIVDDPRRRRHPHVFIIDVSPAGEPQIRGEGASLLEADSYAVVPKPEGGDLLTLTVEPAE